jgi:hypothetical protein
MRSAARRGSAAKKWPFAANHKAILHELIKIQEEKFE